MVSRSFCVSVFMCSSLSFQPPPMARTISTWSRVSRTLSGHALRGTTLRFTASASAWFSSDSPAINWSRVCPGGTWCGAPFKSISIIATPPDSDLAIQLGAILDEFNGFHFHAFFQRRIVRDADAGRVFAHFLGDLHRTEMGAAHGAEMRHLGGILGQGFIVEFACLVRVQADIELVIPAKFKARLGQGVVADLRTRMAFRQIRRMRGDLVGDDAILDVYLV